jgi:hypothetical protein
MRIALVASQSSSPRQRDAAGQSQRVTSLAEALGRLGHQVTLYAPNGSPALPAKATLAPGVTIEHLPGGRAGSRRSSGDEPRWISRPSVIIWRGAGGRIRPISRTLISGPAGWRRWPARAA